MAKCEICKDGKDFKNLPVHVRNKHKMTMMEYNEKLRKPDILEQEEVSTLVEQQEVKPPKAEMLVESDDNIVENITTTGANRTKEIFRDYQKDPNRPLSEFMKEMTVDSEEELRAIIRQFKTGSPLPVHEQMKQRENYADAQAKKLLDKDDVEVTMLATAEVLQNKYGYEVVDVRSPQGTKPKTWVLKRRM